MLGRVISEFPNGVEIVKKQYPGTAGGEVKDLTKVRCGFTKKGGNHCIESDNEQGKINFARDYLGTEALATAGRTTKEKPLPRLQSVRA